jgi:putative colanic acid biosynthesis acetyltransferase WcaF
MGAKIGARVHIYPTAKIAMPWNLEIGDDSAIADNSLIYNLGKVKIGKRVTISHNTQLCAGTHDYKDTSFPLIRAPVNISDEAWICTQALIGPFVTVGRGAIVGAGSVVTRDVPDAAIVAGNPARPISSRAPAK